MKNFLKNYSGVIATLALFIFMAAPMLVSAAFEGGAGGGFQGGAGGGFEGGAGSSNINTNSGSKSLINPLGGVNSFCQLIINLLKAVMIIGVPVAVLFIVWAGFQFVLAQGNPGKLETARRNFLNVIIGIAIFVGASLIASVIVHTLEGLGVEGLNSCAPL